MRYLILTLSAISVLGITSLRAQTFEVTGVNPTDTLNMRAGIDQAANSANAKIVATIPSSATGIKAIGVSMALNGTLWRKISFDGATDWVNARFLRETVGPEMPVNLNCAGTEPFWSLQIQDQNGELKNPELPEPIKLSLIAKRGGLNRSNLWSYYLATGDKASVLTGLVIHTDRCTDGMSNLNYSFEIYLLGFRPGEGPAQGCCSFER